MAGGVINVEEEPIEFVLGDADSDRSLACLLRGRVMEAEDVGGGAEGTDEDSSWLGCDSNSKKLEKAESELQTGANSGGLRMTKASTEP